MLKTNPVNGRKEIKDSIFTLVTGQLEQLQMPATCAPWSRYHN
jgi:hypothetical protein